MWAGLICPTLGHLSPGAWRRAKVARKEPTGKPVPSRNRFGQDSRPEKTILKTHRTACEDSLCGLRGGRSIAEHGPYAFTMKDERKKVFGFRWSNC